MKKFNWEPSAIFIGIVGVILIACTVYVKSQKEFTVTHSDAVASTVGADGRAAVGAPETYTVSISPALAWKKMLGFASAWIIISWVVLALLAVYVGLAANNVIQGSWKPVLVGLAIILASYFGAYSSAFVSNDVQLTKAQYEQVKGNQDALTALFDKPTIR